MNFILCLIFFLSGAAALIFEFLWFRLAGLVLGNSVWSAAIVLSSFMGGLALGNALLALWGERIKRPIRFYAILEIIIAILGGGLVLLLPHLTKILVPLFQPFHNQPLIINAIRIITALILMIVPATAMGATMPVLVKALNQKLNNFGKVLGLLYGSNTLGAVSGVLLAEFYLVKWLGLTMTGYAAMGLNLLAASLAALLSMKLKEESKPLTAKEDVSINAKILAPARNILIVSFFTGLIFLALEVLWFRFMILFFNAYSSNFTILLAAVLIGISCGGFLASLWYRKNASSQFLLVGLLITNAILILLGYQFLNAFLFLAKIIIGHNEIYRILACSSLLIFPVSLVSGFIFTILGKILHEILGVETKTAGLLTLANTLGGMIGSFLGGFALIPLIGVEGSFYLLAILYCTLIFFITDLRSLFSKTKKIIFYPLYALVLYLLAFYPFGLMESYLNVPTTTFRIRGEVRVAFKEGINETIQYLQKNLLGQPHYHRLVTNGHSMSGTRIVDKRYMKLFVYLPVAIHPNPKKAALVCFGCGTTAKALTDTKSFESIEFVDTSKDVIEMSRVIFTDEKTNPINDKRVNIRIEDGRFFLLTTKKKFDLITGEPPPPKYRGVNNLYSQEYFELIYDRLNDGGITTYWLPVYMMHPHEAKSVLKAFCNAFEDCSLWGGSGYHWMMVGIKNPTQPVTVEKFKQQWQDPAIRDEIRLLGFENPEQFASLFIADKNRIEEWTKNDVPLTDNFPKRLGNYHDESKKRINKEFYNSFLVSKDIEENFLQSDHLNRILPKAMKDSSFDSLPHAFSFLLDTTESSLEFIRILHRHLMNPLISEYDINWLLSSDIFAQNIVLDVIDEMKQTPQDFSKFVVVKINKAVEANKTQHVIEWLNVCKHLAVHSLVNGNFPLAENFYQPISHLSDPDNKEDFYYLRIYLMARLNRKDEARKIWEEYKEVASVGQLINLVKYWSWLEETFFD